MRCLHGWSPHSCWGEQPIWTGLLSACASLMRDLLKPALWRQQKKNAAVLLKDNLRRSNTGRKWQTWSHNRGTYALILAADRAQDTLDQIGVYVGAYKAMWLGYKQESRYIHICGTLCCMFYVPSVVWLYDNDAGQETAIHLPTSNVVSLSSYMSHGFLQYRYRVFLFLI